MRKLPNTSTLSERHAAADTTTKINLSIYVIVGKRLLNTTKKKEKKKSAFNTTPPMVRRKGYAPRFYHTYAFLFCTAAKARTAFFQHAPSTRQTQTGKSSKCSVNTNKTHTKKRC